MPVRAPGGEILQGFQKQRRVTARNAGGIHNLTFHVEAMNIETWTIAGERLAAESRALTWAIGDWLLDGNKLGATYEQVPESDLSDIGAPSWTTS
jgi:hypothetical protein